MLHTSYSDHQLQLLGSGVQLFATAGWSSRPLAKPRFRYRVVAGFSAADHAEAEMQLHQLDGMKRAGRLREPGMPRLDPPQEPKADTALFVLILGDAWSFVVLLCFASLFCSTTLCTPT